MKTTKAQRDEWRENGFGGRPFPYAMLPLMDDADLADEAIAALREIETILAWSTADLRNSKRPGTRRGNALSVVRAALAKADAFAAEFQKR